MARERITRARIDRIALELVDRDGFEALSLSSVAAELAVGPSALYTHVDGLDGLRRLVAVAATANLTGRIRDAAIGTSGPAAVSAMGAAYRGFLRDHPGQFASTMAMTADQELTEATAALLDVFVLVYGAMGLNRADATLAARSTRSAIHGFCAIEHATGTSPSHDAEYAHLLQTLERGLRPS